jgi:hypothetical protein
MHILNQINREDWKYGIKKKTIWETYGKHMGNIWETYGEIMETYGNHMGKIIINTFNIINYIYYE